jgi:proteasome lid subunit RPN8/RPN11
MLRTRLPRRRRRECDTIGTPTIRFTPTAWAKLLWLRDRGDTEIGGFGITIADPLRIEDVVLVAQQTSLVTVAFDDAAVAEFFEQQVDQGRRPEQFARIWIHTHPGNSPRPSPTDEETFARVFGRCDWAVMLILARGGATFARLEWHVGPGGALLVPVRVDFETPFGGSDVATWSAEYDQCVHPLGPAHGWDWFDEELVPRGVTEECGDVGPTGSSRTPTPKRFSPFSLSEPGARDGSVRSFSAAGGSGAGGTADFAVDQRDRGRSDRPAGGPAAGGDWSPSADAGGLRYG